MRMASENRHPEPARLHDLMRYPEVGELVCVPQPTECGGKCNIERDYRQELLHQEVLPTSPPQIRISSRDLARIQSRKQVPLVWTLPWGKHDRAGTTREPHLNFEVDPPTWHGPAL